MRYAVWGWDENGSLCATWVFVNVLLSDPSHNPTHPQTCIAIQWALRIVREKERMMENKEEEEEEEEEVSIRMAVSYESANITDL